MAYQIVKNQAGEKEILINGWEQGIARSPLSGIANIQGANIQTENKEVMPSYARALQSQTGTTATNHTFNPVDASHVSTSFTLTQGMWISISASTISNLSTGTYYVLTSNGTSSIAATSVALSQFYNSSAVGSLGATGTATFTLLRAMGQPIASATEFYSNGSQQYRYYILDANGLVWVQDSALGTNWFLPDSNLVTGATGIAVLNGWLHVFAGSLIWCKPTVNLGDSTSTSTNYGLFASGQMLTSNTHFAYVGHQGSLYYTDGNFIGKIFPDSSLLSGTANIQSYASYTASSTTGTISRLIAGSIPYNGTSNSIRIPAVFFHSLTASGANPSGLTIGTIYYIKYLPNSSGFTDTSTFEVYAASSGGSAINLATGAVGTQYFVTYYPTSADGKQTITFSPERLNLPFFENSTSIAEAGNLVIIGTKLNVLYPWNQVDVTPNDLIPLPENDVSYLLTVNNMAYVFAGHKGNIYLTNGSTAALVTTVPDYCAGIAGTPNSYIEPYFTFGGAMYLRGRVYFSILDQTSAKAGNCGGVWSFVPTQNFFIGQDTGLSLRMENQNSYATYSGVSTVLLASQDQSAKGPQYWSGWYSSISGPTYGIDFSSTGTDNAFTTTIETDLIPTGTLLEKQSFAQIEYKVAAPLDSSSTVGIAYRKNGTSSYTSLTPVIAESTTDLSGYYTVDFENTQWLQLKISLSPGTVTTGSFPRLTEIRVR